MHAMKHNTHELTGALLDQAVAKAIGLDDAMARDLFGLGCPDFMTAFHPSSSWLHGGPIIEREGIELHCIDRNGRRMGEWMSRHSSKQLPLHFGPTPLVAAMRAFVASKLGEEVELP
jgi:hypothetical protein